MTHRTLKTRYRLLARRYGLQIKRIIPYDSLYKRNAAYRAITDRGDFLIKPFCRSRVLGQRTARQQIERISSHIRTLQKAGYPHLPKWLRTSSGRYWTFYQGKPYYMTEWIKGRGLQNDAQDYDNLGKALAGLHSVCQSSRLPMSRFTLKEVGALKRRDALFRRQLVRLDRRLGRWFRKHGAECIALADEAWKIMETPEIQRLLQKEHEPPALIHGDVTVPNVIIRPDGLFLIDWDRVRRGSIYLEIARTLLNTALFEPLYMEAMLRGYEQLKPLLPEERLLISAFFRLPGEAWLSANRIAFGRSRYVDRVLTKTWGRRLNAVGWMDRWARATTAPDVSGRDALEEVKINEEGEPTAI
ncbi:phosphotransferase [Paenibacillus sp. MZ04-78.2]|uniref:phosphotransferase n=1 Tax=Paenibacillus sp. MZ04-78.2 TaxID=2962034 RepID=UPI0020B75448|nr:phosphotransferase [Paenibacillus sp. MZ04-78.2]MCP3774931.1 phosphotransferase [Paenibacillus sp. MZ04-78.2]